MSCLEAQVLVQRIDSLSGSFPAGPGPFTLNFQLFFKAFFIKGKAFFTCYFISQVIGEAKCIVKLEQFFPGKCPAALFFLGLKQFFEDTQAVTEGSAEFFLLHSGRQWPRIPCC